MNLLAARPVYVSETNNATDKIDADTINRNEVAVLQLNRRKRSVTVPTFFS